LKLKDVVDVATLTVNDVWALFRRRTVRGRERKVKGDREGEREIVCVSVCVRREEKRMREGVCVCVFVLERE